MKKTYRITTESADVVKFKDLNASGLLIPLPWFQVFRLESGKPHLPACLVLAEICFWHRPVTIEDDDGKFLRHEKKFAGAQWHMSYREFSKKVRLTERQIRDAVSYLVREGMIIRNVQGLKLDIGTVCNFVYITPVYERIKQISEREDASRSKANDDPVETEGAVTLKRKHRPRRIVEHDTEITDRVDTDEKVHNNKKAPLPVSGFATDSVVSSSLDSTPSVSSKPKRSIHQDFEDEEETEGRATPASQPISQQFKALNIKPLPQVHFEDEEEAEGAIPANDRSSQDFEELEDLEDVIHRVVYNLRSTLPKRLPDSELAKLDADTIQVRFSEDFEKLIPGLRAKLDSDSKAVLTAKIVYLWLYCSALYGESTSKWNLEDVEVAHNVNVHELGICYQIVKRFEAVHLRNTTETRFNKREVQLMSARFIGKFCHVLLEGPEIAQHRGRNRKFIDLD